MTVPTHCSKVTSCPVARGRGCSCWSPAQGGNTQNTKIPEEWPPAWGEGCSPIAGRLGTVRDAWRSNAPSLPVGLAPLTPETETHGRITAGRPRRAVGCASDPRDWFKCVWGATVGVNVTQALGRCVSRSYFCCRGKRTQLKLP